MYKFIFRFSLPTLCSIALVLLCCTTTPTLASNSATLQPIDQIVAIVNETPILLSELHSAQSSYLDNTSLAQAREVLIDQTLQLQVAQRLHLTVSEKQVVTAIEQLAKNSHLTLAGLSTQLAQQGMTFSTYKAIIRKQLLLQTLQQEVVISRADISEQDISHYIARYNTKQRKTVYHIEDFLIPVPGTSSAAEKKASASAIAIAEAMQKGVSLQGPLPTKQDLGWQTEEGLPEAFVPVVKKLKIRQVSEPIRAENGYHILRLVGKESNAPALSKTAARRVLLNEKAASTLQTWKQEVRNTAYIQKLPLDQL